MQLNFIMTLRVTLKIIMKTGRVLKLAIITAGLTGGYDL